jgi:NADP-dependent 3-hydroxy acid dehydrogenase YdfG
MMRTYRAASIPPEAIGDAIAYAIAQPSDVDVNEMVIRPARQR